MANAIKQRILLVDDHKEFREELRSFIEKRFADIEICEAQTSAEGIRIMANCRPEVIIVDLDYQPNDGLLAQLQENCKNFSCNMIIMSMFEDSVNFSGHCKSVFFIKKREIDRRLITTLEMMLKRSSGKEVGHDNRDRDCCR